MPPPTFMIAPAICWSSVGADAPHAAPAGRRRACRRRPRRTPASRPARWGRPTAGTGRSSCRPGRGGTPRSARTTGIHISSDVVTTSTCSAVVQRTVLDRCVHDAGNVRDHHRQVEDHAGRDRLAQPPHRAVQPAVADQRPQQPRRRGEQRQRRQEVAEHHVLQHVRRVQVLLADVVDRPVARRPQQQHRGAEAAPLATAHRRLAERHRVRADHPHHVHVGAGQERRRAARPRGATRIGTDRR